MKHDRVSALRVKNCPVSEAEWSHILEAILLQQGLADDIRVTAVVQADSSISLIVRKQVHGITVRRVSRAAKSVFPATYFFQQRLGAIALECNQNEGIELFRWCELSIDALAQAKREVSAHGVKAIELESAVAELQAQLDELVQAKQDDESALLLKFRDLLNEKKVKIREQQMVIASMSSNQGPPSSAQQPQVGGQTARQPTAHRPAKKRKAGPGSASDPDEAMADDAVKQEPEDTDPGKTTGATSSTAGEDEDDTDPPVAQRAARQQGKGRETRPGQAAQAPPPPRRNLPFASKKAPAPATGGDTDSDDEL